MTEILCFNDDMAKKAAQCALFFPSARGDAQAYSDGIHGLSEVTKLYPVSHLMGSNDGEMYVSRIRMVTLAYTGCRESEIHAWIEAFPENRNDCSSNKRWSASLKRRLGPFLHKDIRESCALFKVDQAGTGADVSGVVAPTPMQWASLQLLQPLALLKLARTSHNNYNFGPTLREFISVGMTNQDSPLPAPQQTVDRM